MTQEEKNLLLKDLCGRLPYGVMCRYQHIQYIENGKLIDINMFGRVNIDGHIKDVCDIKPYLFPLSSMTEEQKNECFKGTPLEINKDGDIAVKEDLHGGNQYTDLEIYLKVINWFHKNHFDYRGLIPMGSAIDATCKNIY